MFSEKENKIWGETRQIFKGNNTETHIINAVAGGYCSKHYHEHKYNYFYVDSGELLIEIWRENKVVDKTVLHNGESIMIDPGVYHRFTAKKNTRAIEIYWVELYDRDIIREDQGGVKK